MATSSSAGCTARCCSVGRASSSTRSDCGRTRGATPRFDRAARVGVDSLARARGELRRAGERVDGTSCAAGRGADLAVRSETHRRADGLPVAARHVVERSDRDRRRGARSRRRSRSSARRRGRGAPRGCVATTSRGHAPEPGNWPAELAGELGGRAGSIPSRNESHGRTTGCDLHDAAAGEPMVARDECRAIAGAGLDGDRYATKTGAVLRCAREPVARSR